MRIDDPKLPQGSLNHNTIFMQHFTMQMPAQPALPPQQRFRTVNGTTVCIIPPSTPDECKDAACSSLWQQYHAERIVAKRKTLKAQYNILAKHLNTYYGRNIYLSIR